ncbi:MAG TPA: SDR family NAD(P)-dependent oxidoreductase [Desulfotomaculum sp.]|nr:SDR family NAD(P)-dependent oxidoreductase [Desulfotomaculum sp.]
MKAAVITGGARGIGKAIAHELLGRGFRRLAITARTREKLQAAEESLTAAGAQVLAFAADVCDCEAMGAVVREVIETFGRVDLWVNNAGVAQRKAFAATTPAE